MKVAIIGAGVAGLSCAYQLERHGINPTIFEVNSYIGEQYSHVGATLEAISRPISNPIKYFKRNFSLDITPLAPVNSVIHHSQNKTTEIKGDLGYFFLRSKEPEDIKNQIYSKLKYSNVQFTTSGDYQSLSKEYDYVVIANGHYNYANELGCWYEHLDTYIRGAVVLGDFDPNTLIVWINKDYCKNGYAYLTPFNNKRASLILIVTDVNGSEIDAYWDLFLFTENLKYTVVEEYKQNHRSGFVYPHRVGNILLAGNTGGVIDPFLGFGILDSVVTGSMAARAIINNEDYEVLIKEFTKKGEQLYEFRKSYEKLDNKAYDILISSLKLPGLKQVMYYSPLNVIKYGSHALRTINNRNNKK